MLANGKCPYAVIIPGDKQHTVKFHLFKTSAFLAHRVSLSVLDGCIGLQPFLPRFHCELSYNFSNQKKLEYIDHQVGKVMVY